LHSPTKAFTPMSDSCQAHFRFMYHWSRKTIRLLNPRLVPAGLRKLTLTFSTALLARLPNIAFIDDDVWPSECPPTCSAIQLCESNFVFLWSRDAVPEIRGQRREDGMFKGPGPEWVVQFIRSIMRDGYLCSWRLAWESDEDDPTFKEVVH
jgi:hypothetical protein